MRDYLFVWPAFEKGMCSCPFGSIPDVDDKADYCFRVAGRTVRFLL